MTLLGLDTETGGLTNDSSILSLYMGIYRFGKTRIFKKTELNLFVKPDDNLYHVNPEALAVNRINLVQHNYDAIPYKEAGAYMYNFLQEAYKEAEEKLVLVGQNVHFDLEHIFSKKLIAKNTWEQFVDRRHLDTMCIGRFASLAGYLPENQSCSLSNLSKALGCPMDGRQHDAAYDVEQTVKVLFKFRNLMQKGLE